MNRENAISEAILQKKIEIVWDIDDVKSIADDLDDDECMEVLLLAKDYHDANVGINWEVLESWAEVVRDRRYATEYDNSN